LVEQHCAGGGGGGDETLSCLWVSKNIVKSPNYFEYVCMKIRISNSNFPDLRWLKTFILALVRCSSWYVIVLLALFGIFTYWPEEKVSIFLKWKIQLWDIFCSFFVIFQCFQPICLHIKVIYFEGLRLIYIYIYIHVYTHRIYILIHSFFHCRQLQV